MDKIDKNYASNAQSENIVNNSISPEDEKIKRVACKAKEAEDVVKRPEHFQRRASVSQLNRLEKTEKEEITARSGEIWECISRKPNKLGGYIYAFRMKNEYISNPDALKAKANEIFPAAEIRDGDQFEFRSIPKELGYLKEGQGKNVCLHILDREALLANWQKLRERRPELPPLKILASEGIADDREYVEAYFSYDVLLSSGKEFFHDSIKHVCPLLGQIAYQSETKGVSSYREERVRILKIFASIYRTLMIVKKEVEEGKKSLDKDLLNKLVFGLGYIVDVVSTFAFTDGWTKQDIQGFYQEFWLSKDLLSGLLQRRFGGAPFTQESFDSVWKEVQRIEKQFDDFRKQPDAVRNF